MVNFIFLFLTDISILVNFSYEVDMDRFFLLRGSLKPSKSTLECCRLIVNFILEEQLLSSLTKTVHEQPESLFTINRNGFVRSTRIPWIPWFYNPIMPFRSKTACSAALAFESKRSEAF
jgi:hypothetical protein